MTDDDIEACIFDLIETNMVGEDRDLVREWLVLRFAAYRMASKLWYFDLNDFGPEAISRMVELGLKAKG